MSFALTHSTSFSWFLSLAHLPSPPCHYFPGDFNVLIRHSSSILLPISSRVLCSSHLAVPSAPSTEARTQGSPVLHLGWWAGKRCAFGEISRVQLSTFCTYLLSNPILRPAYFLCFIGIPFPCWVLMKWKKSLCLNLLAGEAWPGVLDPGTVFPICGGRH